MDGLVDIHSHLLPGIDDGPPDMAATVEMARAASAAGIATMAATPHLRADFPDVHVEEIAERCAEVQAEIEAANIALRVVSGAECSLVWAAEASEEHLRLASFGQRGHDLLVETPSDVSMLEQLLYRVRLKGLRVTLAHPERSGAFRENPDRLERLVEQGILLQVNAGGILGPRRSGQRQLAERLCRKGLAHVLASDGHRGEDWRPVASLAPSAEALGVLVGHERVRWMTVDVPAAILAGEPLPPESPVRRRRRLGVLHRRSLPEV